MNDPRICIVGAGTLATRRIYPYIGAAGAQLVGVCDLDQEKAQRNARRFGGQAYDNLARMLDEQKPDGVIVCVGPRGHAPLAIQVMQAGYPVYTEKPPACSSSETYRMACASKQTGRLCMTAFKKRHNQAYTRARKWLDGFSSQDIYSISVDYCSAQYPNDSLERTFLFDFCIHLIDLIGFLGGDVAEVFAFAKGQDAFAVSLRFANGAVGSMNLADGRSFVVPTEEVEITVKGGNFMTIHNSSVWKITEGEKPVEWREPPTFTSSGDSGNDTGHLAEIAEFLAAIKERRSTVSAIYESYKSMVLYEAIERSARSGAIAKIHYEVL